MFERFTRDARAVVISTQNLCHGLGADEVRPVHLLLALTEKGRGVSDLLARHGVTTTAVARCLGVAAPPAPPERPAPAARQATAPLDQDDAAALRSLGIDLDAIRDAVERQFGEGALDEATKATSGDSGGSAPSAEDPAPWAEDDGPSGEGAGPSGAHEDAGWGTRGRFRRGGHIRFGRGSKKVLELSLREAIRTGAGEIRTEHVALGLLRADDDAVTMVIRTLGADPRALRADLEGHGRRTA